MRKQIQLTPAIEQVLRHYEIAAARFTPGSDSTSLVELPLLAIGQEVATALGLPTLRDLFTGAAVVLPVARYTPRPVKVQTARSRAGPG
jgi:hypothetical protein